MSTKIKNFKKQFGAIALGFMFVSSTAVFAQNLETPLPIDPSTTKGTFANGLTYYIRTNKKPANKVELRLVVNAGSILEDDDQQGLAHFMEHMNFNGLKHFEKNEIVNYLQSIGVQFGADLNANTGFDRTLYILPIPTDKEGNLDKGFQILEDWAHQALLTDADIDGERPVVLEESRLGKGADDRMLKQYFPKYAAGTKYAKRLPIGLDNILKTFKYNAVRRFYHDWYRPNLEAVIVVGDIDKEKAMGYLKKHFEGLVNPTNAKPRTTIAAPVRLKPDALVCTDKEASSTEITLMFPHTKIKEDKTLGDYKKSIIESLAMNMLNTRYNDLTLSSNPPFPYAGTGFDNLIQGYRSLVVSSTFGKEGPQKVIDALVAELIRAKQFGFNNTELDIAKTNYLSNLEKSFNERKTTNSAAYVDEMVRNFMNKETMPGIVNEYSYTKQMAPSITLEEVNAVIKTLMPNNNVFTLVTAPESQKANLPSNTALIASINKAFQQKVTPLIEKKIASTLMETKPVAGKVVSQVEDKDLGITTYTLSNGMKITLKPTDFKTDEILLKGVRYGGYNNFPAEDNRSVLFAADVVDAMGVGKFDPTTLEKVLTGKKIETNFSIDDTKSNITANSTIKDFETMLQLLHLTMTDQRVDEPLFKSFIDKTKQQLQFVSANPQSLFVDTTFKVFYKNSPYARMIIPSEKDLNAVDMKKAISIFKTSFGSADGYNFFLVGNLDAKTIIPLLETYLGSIPAVGKVPELKDAGLRPLAGISRLNVKKGTEKKSMILESFTGELPYTEDLSLRLQAVTEVLNIVVIEQIREKMGAIYGGGLGGQFLKEPYPHYSITGQLPCGPENVDKILVELKREINELKDKGPEAKNVDKVKAQWIEAFKTKSKENKFWVDKLSGILFDGKDKNHTLNYEGWINSLTAKDIQDAAKLFFDGKNEFTSVLFPEN